MESLPNHPTMADSAVKDLIGKSQDGDTQARDCLVESNLRLVKSIVNRFLTRGFDEEDLFQVGCIGLVKAIDGFDLSYDVRFSTYAVPKIIGEIKRFMRESSSLKISRPLKELASRAIACKDEMATELGRAPSISELAERLQTTSEELVAALDAVAPIGSLQQVVYSGDDDQLLLEDQLSVFADYSQMVELKDALEALDPLSRKLVLMRYFAENSQTEVAASLGISQAQVSRIEKRILEELRGAVENG